MEEDAIQFLLLHAPMKRDDAVNVMALLDMIVASEESAISQAKMMDVLVGYAAGEFNSELAESRLSTPSGSASRSSVSQGLRFTPRSAGRASVALSAMTEEMEEDPTLSGAGSVNAGVFEGVGFSTRLEDDEVTAETSYDPAQTQFLLTRVNDLTGGLVKVSRRLNSVGIDQATLASGLGKVELEVEALQDNWARKRAKWTTEAASTEGKVAATATRVEESLRAQRILNDEFDGRLLRVEEPFRSPTGFPALFTKVSELATTVNGSVDGPPGAGLDERMRRFADRPGGSFGLSLGASPNAEAGGREPRVRALEAEVATLRGLLTALSAKVELFGTAPVPGGVAGIGNLDIYDRLEALEQRGTWTFMIAWKLWSKELKRVILSQYQKSFSTTSRTWRSS